MNDEFSFKKHAQNGVRRGNVPDPLGGARRTLCAFEVLALCLNLIKPLIGSFKFRLEEIALGYVEWNPVRAAMVETPRVSLVERIGTLGGSLCGEDSVVNHKPVRRILREDNLLSLRRRRYVLTTDAHHPYWIYPNVAVPALCCPDGGRGEPFCRGLI